MPQWPGYQLWGSVVSQEVTLLLEKKADGMYVVIDSRAREEDHWPENNSSLWGVVSVRWRPGLLPLCLYCSGVFAIKMLHGTRITKNMFLKR